MTRKTLFLFALSLVLVAPLAATPSARDVARVVVVGTVEDVVVTESVTTSIDGIGFARSEMVLSLRVHMPDVFASSGYTIALRAVGSLEPGIGGGVSVIRNRNGSTTQVRRGDRVRVVARHMGDLRPFPEVMRVSVVNE